MAFFHEEVDQKAVPLVQSPPRRASPSTLGGLVILVKGNLLNLLLPLVPLTLFLEQSGFSDIVVFGVGCVSLLPLAGLLGELTEQIALHTNDTLGGLLNATFGNATELIVSYFALEKGLLSVVKSSLMGSILSNLLLVLGCSILAAGVRAGPGKETPHNLISTQSNTELLLVSILGLAVPTICVATNQMSIDEEAELSLSRVISVCLLVLYALYILFQLGTHPNLFDGHNDKEEEEEEEEEATLPLGGALVLLAGCTALVAIVSEAITGAIEGAAAELGVNPIFVGFVILPIVGNAAEHSTAVVMAWKHKIDVAFGVALGSSTQIALFAVPLMVLVAIPLGQPLDLCFGEFETVVVFIAALIVSMICEDASTNWLEGAMLIIAYVIICTAYFFSGDPVATNALEWTLPRQ